MARKHKTRARKHHLGTTSGAAITVRPPSPPRPPTPPVADADHSHKKHMKRRVILQAWGAKGPGPYEVEFCPDCPLEDVRSELLQIRQDETAVFSRATQLVFYGLSKGIYGVKYSPELTKDMAAIMGLIKTRHLKGGKVIFRIVNKRPPANYPVTVSAVDLLTKISQISFWVIFALSVIIVVTLFAIAVATANSAVGSALLSMLGKVL